MKIQITIPDSIALHDNYRDGLKQVIDNFVSKALEDIERRKLIGKDIDNFQEAIKEVCHGE